MRFLRNIFFLFLLCAGQVLAQPGVSPVQKINGKEYYIHTVKKGETLSGISKKYKCSLATVMNENPGAGDKISIGDQVKIPVTNKNRVASASIQSTERKLNPNKIQPQRRVEM